ncbi:hypothetical protein CDV36_001326 [Fusarium kuroshium]|uniref:Uncharacterized protein n=3 Tax=Fusarium solani species complex TaxID=232080 RepID=A0A3M2SNC5_9HYPO|nr:hypothetical protein CDV36_001326 [Fusarium kuroshium]RSL74816.1 hypothetical protein CEP51_011447 [Fusarium floridanum]RSM16340.1 hypothetical protein CEP52_000082 [Fusarium oligoseptatum]
MFATSRSLDLVYSVDSACISALGNIGTLKMPAARVPVLRWRICTLWPQLHCHKWRCNPAVCSRDRVPKIEPQLASMLE